MYHNHVAYFNNIVITLNVWIVVTTLETWHDLNSINNFYINTYSSLILASRKTTGAQYDGTVS